MNRNPVAFLLFIVVSARCAYGASLLQPVSFPTTKSDTTFVERVDAKREGYAPYANQSAYATMKIESEEEYITNLVSKAEAQRQIDLATMSLDEYCDTYPLDDTKCPQTPGLEEQIVAIGNGPATSTTQPAPTAPAILPSQPQLPSHPSVSQPPATPTAPSGNIVGYSMSGQPVIAGARIHDGPCTAPQRSKNFSNKILTSGRYEHRDPAFEKAMITIFRKEGDCGNHPNDSGGYTCYGIASNANPDINVANITRADAEDIAYERYYAKYGIDRLPDNVRAPVMWWGWGSGPATGIRRLCRVLGISERTKIDNEVVAAAENYNGDLFNAVTDANQAFLRNIATGKNRVFLKGWMNAIKLQRENGCHTPTTDPLSR